MLIARVIHKDGNYTYTKSMSSEELAKVVAEALPVDKVYALVEVGDEVKLVHVANVEVTLVPANAQTISQDTPTEKVAPESILEPQVQDELKDEDVDLAARRV